jgi:hypothetical protein
MLTHFEFLSNLIGLTIDPETVDCLIASNGDLLRLAKFANTRKLAANKGGIRT